MSGTIPLSPEEQTRLTVALELEDAGFQEAAKWVRTHILSLRGIVWKEDPSESPLSIDPKSWEELFRIHRGSLSPVSQPPTVLPPPSMVSPKIRPDQITA